MSGTTGQTACDKLKQAEAAYHNLLIGQQVVSFTDQNGERVQYSQANMSNLLDYIKLLQTACSTYTALVPQNAGLTQPLKFIF